MELRKGHGAARGEVPRRRRGEDLLRPRSERDLRPQVDGAAAEGHRDPGANRQEISGSPGRHALLDPQLRFPGDRPPRRSGSEQVREDRAVGAPCPAHALAHLLDGRHVGRLRDVELALGPGGERVRGQGQARRHAGRRTPCLRLHGVCVSPDGAGPEGARPHPGQHGDQEGHRSAPGRGDGARAVGGARGGDRAAARADIEKLKEQRAALEKAGQGYWAGQVEIQILGAQAWTAQAQGNKSEAIKLMRSAAELEDASEKHVAMENRLYPMRELLGDMLMAQGDSVAALKEYETSLKNAPMRLRGFYGAAKAAEFSGDKKKAREYFEKLAKLTRNADGDRSELRELKQRLASR